MLAASMTAGRERRSRGADRIAILLLLAPLLLGLTPLPAQQFRARVVAVDDGDTIRVVRGRETVRIRLFGVDAPEADQPYGHEAREQAVRLLLNETVEVSMRDVDSYGRLVATLRVQGRDVAEQLVQAGSAWQYTQYSQDPRLAALERGARNARRGLWARTSPIPPWQFRELERAREAAAGPDREAGAAGGARPAAGVLHGNVNSRVFHAPGCENYECPNCTARFASSAAAMAAGYRPHATCAR